MGAGQAVGVPAGKFNRAGCALESVRLRAKAKARTSEHILAEVPKGSKPKGGLGVELRLARCGNWATRGGIGRFCTVRVQGAGLGTEILVQGATDGIPAVVVNTGLHLLLHARGPGLIE